MAKEVSMICEQGDMGLFCDTLSEADQRTYDKQQSKENKSGQKSDSVNTKGDERS